VNALVAARSAEDHSRDRCLTLQITPSPAGPAGRAGSLRAPLADLAPPVWGSRLAGTPYMVVRRIGVGGMGEIYEAEHAALGRRVALKVLNHHDRPDLAARLRGEARLQASLRHPNLVEVFDLGVTPDGRPWFAMPLLRGRDLRDELACRGALPAPAAAALVAQALDGLSAAHAAGFVHRDVKLENLFLEDCGTLKVLDFGVAKVLHGGADGHTDPGGAPGTPRTMAPEQCAGDPADARTDVYAAGLALYELIAGRGPFDELRGSSHALRFAHCERRPVAPSVLAPRPVPPGIEAVILRALAKSPACRFQSAAQMAAALRAALGPSRRRRPRRPARILAAAAVPVLSVVCFALGLLFGCAAPLRAPQLPQIRAAPDVFLPAAR
jgi:eukaryotic-like serine/threonine-protein kinase